jgi:formylglycine-generating enzyme required for sulfatase activity
MVAGMQRTDALGMLQVYVPAGCFMMGSEGNDADEVPVHQVCLTRPFWIDAYEVTHDAYRQFVNAGGYANRAYWGASGGAISQPKEGAGAGSTPRSNVSWFEASAYATWRGCRLPTEAEWEYAARGPEARLWPWGNDRDPAKAHSAERSPASAATVGTYEAGKSWVGAYDMAANIWEWTADFYDATYYSFQIINDPQGPAAPPAPQTPFRVLRGGSFRHDLLAARGADRYWAPPDGTADWVGFRVVCAVTES